MAVHAVDVHRVREADVLVGMHGSGLSNSFFMRRRSALIEVRHAPHCVRPHATRSRCSSSRARALTAA